MVENHLMDVEKQSDTLFITNGIRWILNRPRATILFIHTVRYKFKLQLFHDKKAKGCIKLILI